MTISEACFLIVGLVGAVLLFLSFVLGFDHDFDFGDHDTELSHEVEHDTDNSLQVPSFLSLKVILAAMVGFGVCGSIAAFSGLPALLSWPLAVVGLLVFGIGIHQMVLKPLAKGQSNSMLSRESYLGVLGTVTLSITEGGDGQVTFNNLNGARVTERATSTDGRPIAAGNQVMVIDVSDRGVVVESTQFQLGNGR